VIPGPLDLATDARAGTPPAWLRGRLERALDRLGTHPDPGAALAAVARRHERDAESVLLTAGASEACVLLGRVLQPGRAVEVRPGPAVVPDAEPLVLAPPYVLDPSQVPQDADLVVVANPADPSGVVHERLAELCRPGRTLVVDESRAEGVPGEPQSLASRSDLPGLVVVRSLSSTWALAGLRVGYLLAEPALVARLRAVQAPWPVSTVGLTALETCLARGPVKTAERDAGVLAQERQRLEQALPALGVEVAPGSAAPYLLCRVPGRDDLPEALRDRGILVRSCAGLPGLTAEHWRVSVRGAGETAVLLDALSDALATTPGGTSPSSG
jgi:histidinol-phosphate aminotransferase